MATPEQLLDELVRPLGAWRAARRRRAPRPRRPALRRGGRTDRRLPAARTPTGADTLRSRSSARSTSRRCSGHGRCERSSSTTSSPAWSSGSASRRGRARRCAATTSSSSSANSTPPASRRRCGSALAALLGRDAKGLAGMLPPAPDLARCTGTPTTVPRCSKRCRSRPIVTRPAGPEPDEVDRLFGVDPSD